jgi:hypothetical protein
MMKKWLAIGIVGLIVLGLALVLSGGVYRTVNAGGGEVYVVNRFTGRMLIVSGGVVTRAKSEKEAEAEEAKRAAKEKERQAEARAREIIEAAYSVGADYVGDAEKRIYHEWDPSFRPLGRRELSSSVLEILGLRTRKCLGTIKSPVYLSSALEAASKGYWPCQECMLSETGTVIGDNAKVRGFPRPEAPVWFSYKRGKRVEILGVHGDYYAVPAERTATGERCIGWIPSSAVETELDRELAAIMKREQDRKTALSLRDKGLGVSEIAKKKGWKESYVQRLLGTP